MDVGEDDGSFDQEGELAGERGWIGHGELGTEAGEEGEAGLFAGDGSFVGQVFFLRIFAGGFEEEATVEIRRAVPVTQPIEYRENLLFGLVWDGFDA